MAVKPGGTTQRKVNSPPWAYTQTATMAVDSTTGDESQIAWYIYDMHHSAGILLRQLCPEMHTSGPVRVFRKRSTDDFTGWTVWGCSPVFARLAIERPALFDGKAVLELGAGCGLAGLAVACCTRAASVCISDFPTETMRNLLHNVALNCKRIEAAAAAESAINVELGGERYSLNDAFVSGTGCRITLAQIDWDVEATWPRPAPPPSTPAAGTEGGDSSSSSSSSPPLFRQFEVIIAADLLPRESYGRSLAHVVRGLLAPGGCLVAVTPAVREGLPVLQAELLLQGGGGEGGEGARDGCSDVFAVEEECVDDDWRANPLRSPEDGEKGRVVPCPPEHSHVAAPAFGGAAHPSLPASALPEALARAGCSAERLKLVTAEGAADMFPELSRPTYNILAVTFTRPPLQGPAA